MAAGVRGARAPGAVALAVENLGPFERAEVELKPLTVLVGRPGTGKSTLARLAWALESLASTDSRGIVGRLREVFGAEPRELVRVGAERARAVVLKRCGRLEVAIGRSVEASSSAKSPSCFREGRAAGVYLYDTRALASPARALEPAEREILGAAAHFTNLGDAEIEAVNGVLGELGCRVAVGGGGAVYINSWSGKVHHLYRAPASVRRVVPVLLSLVAPGLRIVYVEEPEAGLHARAVLKLAELVARAAARGKRVVVTTHSRELVAAACKAAARAAGERGEGGFSLDDAAVYLLRTEGGRALVERLRVAPGGMPEEDLERVSSEVS
ncbi:MAG: AAA family ATPase [Thermoproteaceae archaeon]|nr:AAA family ATPase [Thermoproteaceae archaeon]